MVLLCLGSDPPPRVRDVARSLSLTERTVQRIIGELVARDCVRRYRMGRRTFYVLNLEAIFHPAHPELTLGRFLSNVQHGDSSAEAALDQAV